MCNAVSHLIVSIIQRYSAPQDQGWQFSLWFIKRILRFCQQKSKIEIRSQSLFLKERREQFTHSRSFLKSDESDSLPLLFKKERRSEERWEPFALGHKRG